ncbi:MAG: cation transporter [Acidobacteria bacterium]|nr:cation transporter [Acidobacteriota bacterium]
MTADTSHHSVSGNLRLAFFLNLGFTVLEIVGGLWTNSLAILADAVHDLGDSLALGMAWYFEKYSQRAGDRLFSYGYRRFSLLGAVISAAVLITGSLFILSEVIPRLLQPEPAHAPGMILFAVVGVTVNGLAVLRLRGHHGLNARIVAWHLLEDVLGWLAVLVVGILFLFRPVYILDPILSGLITLYVLFNVVKSLRKALNIFLQAVPEGMSIDDLERSFRRLPHVRSTHHTHVWSLDGERHVLSTHVVVDAAISKEQIVILKQGIREIIRDLDIQHSTVEIEFGDEPCRISETIRRHVSP